MAPKTTAFEHDQTIQGTPVLCAEMSLIEHMPETYQIRHYPKSVVITRRDDHKTVELFPREDGEGEIYCWITFALGCKIIVLND